MDISINKKINLCCFEERKTQCACVTSVYRLREGYYSLVMSLACIVCLSLSKIEVVIFFFKKKKG